MFSDISKYFFFYLPLIIILLSFCATSESISSCQNKAAISKCHDRLLLEAQNFAAIYRKCLLNQLRKNDTKIWNRLPSAVRSCFGHKKFSKAFNVSQIGMPKPRDLSKFIILPPSMDSCVVVITRQLANEIGPRQIFPEEDLVRREPKCKIHVAILEGHGGGQIGKYYNNSIVFAEPGSEKFKSIFAQLNLRPVENPRIISLKSFLEKIVNKGRIDYLWLDFVDIFYFGADSTHAGKAVPETCYSEYSIFNDPINVTVCQVSLQSRIFTKREMDKMEFARPLLADRILSAISNSSFLPIHSEYLDHYGLLRTFYMNMADPYCLKKFLAPTVCGQICQAVKKQIDPEILKEKWRKFQALLNRFEDDLKKTERDFKMKF